jgi:aspartate kinase
MAENLSRVFHLFSNHGIKVNVVEASAVSIDVCVDDERSKVNALLDELKADYAAVYNENVEILSVRHHTPAAIERIIKDRDVLLEQRTRTTVRYIVRKDKGGER